MVPRISGAPDCHLIIVISLISRTDSFVIHSPKTIFAAVIGGKLWQCKHGSVIFVLACNQTRISGLKE